MDDALDDLVFIQASGKDARRLKFEPLLLTEQAYVVPPLSGFLNVLGKNPGSCAQASHFRYMLDDHPPCLSKFLQRVDATAPFISTTPSSSAPTSSCDPSPARKKSLTAAEVVAQLSHLQPPPPHPPTTQATTSTSLPPPNRSPSPPPPPPPPPPLPKGKGKRTRASSSTGTAAKKKPKKKADVPPPPGKRKVGSTSREHLQRGGKEKANVPPGQQVSASDVSSAFASAFANVDQIAAQQQLPAATTSKDSLFLYSSYYSSNLCHYI